MSSRVAIKTAAVTCVCLAEVLLSAWAQGREVVLNRMYNHTISVQTDAAYNRAQAAVDDINNAVEACRAGKGTRAQIEAKYKAGVRRLEQARQVAVRSGSPDVETLDMIMQLIPALPPNCGTEAGVLAPYTQFFFPGFEGSNVTVDATASVQSVHAPKFDVGSTFSAAAGKEVGIFTFNQRLTGGGGSVSFTLPGPSSGTSGPAAVMPLPAAKRGMEVSFGFYNATGNASGMVPAGAANVAFNAIDGSGGPGGVAVGQQVLVDAKLNSYNFGFMNWIGIGGAGAFDTSVGLGVNVSHTDITNDISQTSLLPGINISSTTTAKVRDTFAGAIIGFDAVIRPPDAPFFVDLTGTVAAGNLFQNGSADQRIVCSVCVPGFTDRSFNMSFSGNAFTVKTGASASIATWFTPNLKGALTVGYNYTSDASVIRVPTSGTAGPATLDRSSIQEANFRAILSMRLNDVASDRAPRNPSFGLR